MTTVNDRTNLQNGDNERITTTNLTNVNGHHHMLSVAVGNTLPSIHSLQASLEVGGQLLATKSSPVCSLLAGQLQMPGNGNTMNGSINGIGGQQSLMPVTVKKVGRRGRPPKKDAKSRNRQGTFLDTPGDI